MNRFLVIVGVIASILGVSPCFAEEVLRLATTTSTYETGLLDHIFPPFEQEYNVKIHVIAVGTGKAIKLGENGDVDIIMVHAKKAEEEFVNQGLGLRRHTVMYNDFVILGPQDDPANISGLSDTKAAFGAIHSSKSVFVSRGDDSGTHKKEKSIWEGINISPQPSSYYLEAGQGMSATLRMADEKDAYIFVDRGTYIKHKDKMRLNVLVEGDPILFNQYGVIAVNPQMHKHVKMDLARSLIDWLVSPECQKLIDDFRISGYKLFTANANKQ